MYSIGVFFSGSDVTYGTIYVLRPQENHLITFHLLHIRAFPYFYFTWLF